MSSRQQPRHPPVLANDANDRCPNLWIDEAPRDDEPDRVLLADRFGAVPSPSPEGCYLIGNSKLAGGECRCVVVRRGSYPRPEPAQPASPDELGDALPSLCGGPPLRLHHSAAAVPTSGHVPDILLTACPESASASASDVRRVTAVGLARVSFEDFLSTISPRSG